MRLKFQSILLLCLAAGMIHADDQSPSSSPGFSDWLARLLSAEVRKMDEHRFRLTKEVQELPVPAAENSSIRHGWHSRFLNIPSDTAWVQVDLGEMLPIDLVALVPALGKSEQESGPGYGFPRGFRIELSESADFARAITISDVTQTAIPNPGAFPFITKVTAQRGRFVRVTVVEGWQRRTDSIAAFGEIMVLSRNRNVAAGRPVTASGSVRSIPAWMPENLTDGQSQLGAPVSTEISLTDGYLAAHETGSPHVIKWVQVDLGQEFPLDELRLFPSRPALFVDSPGHGFPLAFRVETAAEMSFEHPQLIFDSGENDFIHPGENPVVILAKGKRGRFIRVTATKLQSRGSVVSFSLAELQAWSGNSNVALGKPVTALDVVKGTAVPRWSPAFLVDGYNSRHRILDWSAWLIGLDRRREIAAELLRLDQARAQKVDDIMAMVIRSGAGAVAGVLLLSVAFYWRVKLIKRREVDFLRQRIASDLHDEIGSQLGSIALAAQLAQRRLDDPETARERFTEIERIARETTESMHDIVWLLKPGNANLAELAARLRETHTTLLRGQDCQFTLSGETSPRPLPIEFTRNFYLAYKEMLANIAKHARAQTVKIDLVVRDNRMDLTVQDDGVGFTSQQPPAGEGLGNLRRRADQLGATLNIASVPGGGTTITFSAPLRNRIEE